MTFFRYRLTLFDPLYYAREGLFGAYTPQVLHATAVNHAMTSALGLHPDRQPYVIAETNGGMDVPRYADSRASALFYFTPAALEGPSGDWTEIAKGDSEGFSFRVEAGEILKATQLHFLRPETQFAGLALALDDEPAFPQRIRLGSFRGAAGLEWEPALSAEAMPGPAPVDHPVDPLVSRPVRGVMLNLFPYPLVQNAVCPRVYRLKFPRSTFGSAALARLAWPDGYAEPTPIERTPRGSVAIF
jgi:hypothetical protein